MTNLYRIVTLLSWVLGLVSIALAAITKVMHLSMKVRVEASTFMLVASTFFLCALATRALDRS